MHDALPDNIGGFALERRRSRREQVIAIGKLHPMEASDSAMPTVSVLVTDVSLHGCDFRAAVAPRDGAFYRIDLAVGPLSMSSRVRIIRVHPRADATFEAAGEFV